MLRITTLRLNGGAPSGTGPLAAIQALNDAAAAAGKVAGIRNLRWYFGNGGVVFVGESDTYASADALLADAGFQGAFAKVLALGYGIAEDHFLLEAAKVMPFTPQA
jgi:hypothetical protein